MGLALVIKEMQQRLGRAFPEGFFQRWQTVPLGRTAMGFMLHLIAIPFVNDFAESLHAICPLVFYPNPSRPRLQLGRLRAGNRTYTAL